MRPLVFTVLWFGAINVYAAPEAKGEKTHNVTIKMVNVGLIQMDVNAICRAAGYVNLAELATSTSSGVMSGRTLSTFKEHSESITDEYDGSTTEISSTAEEYFPIDPRIKGGGTAETVTEHTTTSTEIRKTTTEKLGNTTTEIKERHEDKSSSDVSKSSDKETTKNLKETTEERTSVTPEDVSITTEKLVSSFLLDSDEHSSSTATEKGVNRKTISETEKGHKHITTSEHGYTTTPIEDGTPTTKEHGGTVIEEGHEHKHDATPPGIRTTRDTKETTEEHTAITSDDGLSEIIGKLIGSSTLSGENTTSIAIVEEDVRSPTTTAHSGLNTSVLSTTPTNPTSFVVVDVSSTTVSEEHTVAKEHINSSTPAADRITVSSSSPSGTPTEEEHKTSPVNGSTTEERGIPPIAVESSSAGDVTPTTESEKSSVASTTTVKEGDKITYDDRFMTEEYTRTTVEKEHIISNTSAAERTTVHKKEASEETITVEYYEHATTSDEELKPTERGTSATVAETGVPATTERNYGTSTDKIKSDSGKKVDYSVYGYLALSLLLAAIIIWISYVVYTRHQSNSYVLPATAAEATPLNHITSTT